MFPFHLEVLQLGIEFVSCQIPFDISKCEILKQITKEHAYTSVPCMMVGGKRFKRCSPSKKKKIKK